MNRGLISVIVPVFNTEKYLDKCIKSIIDQDYMNLEIIIVDDGSSDNSGKICNKWKKTDNRIKVIHKPNGGLSSARNCGLDKCTGDYIGFVDSDDSIELDMYSTLLQQMLAYNAEISICQFKKVDESGARINLPYEDGIHQYSGDEAMKFLIEDKIITSHPCNKLFTRSLWENSRFPEDRIYEDIAIMHKIFKQATSVVVTNQEKYNYLIRFDSTSFRTDSKRDYGLFLAFYERYSFIQSTFQDERLIKQCFSKAIVEGIGAVYRMNYYQTKGYQEGIAKIQIAYRENIIQILQCKELTTKQKMKVILIAYFFPAYKKICMIYRKANKEGSITKPV